MIYEAICMECGKYHEYIRKAADCMDTPECCGKKTVKHLLTAPQGIVDIPAYQSPATGKMIHSRAQRREDMKRSGSREWEGMESEKNEANRQMKYQEAKADAKLDETVRMAYAQLPAQKKAQLIKEIGG